MIKVDSDHIPYYGVVKAKISGHDCIISQTGFSGEAGYEVYLLDSTLHAEDVWYAILEAGKKHQLMVTAPPSLSKNPSGNPFLGARYG